MPCSGLNAPMPKPATIANATAIGMLPAADNKTPPIVMAANARINARSRPSQFTSGESGMRPPSWQKPRSPAIDAAVALPSPAAVMTGTWNTSMVDMARPPNPTAMVNKRGAGADTVDAKTCRTDGRAVGATASVAGRTAAAVRNARPVTQASTRTATRQPSSDCSQSEPGRKIADANAPQMVSTAMALVGWSGLSLTAVVMVT